MRAAAAAPAAAPAPALGLGPGPGPAPALPTADPTAPFQPDPTKSDLLPASRISTRYKDVKELNDDIQYFLINFKSALVNESLIYKKLNKKDKKLLIRLHNKIMGKINTGGSSSGSNNNILIGVDADRYIEEQMKRLIAENAFSSLTAADAVVPVDDKLVKDTRNIGSYEIKKNPDGGLSSRKEAAYRYEPTVQPPVPKKKGRLVLLNRVQRNQVRTAQKMVQNNPFLKKSRGLDISYFY